MPTLEAWSLWLHIAAGAVAVLAGVGALVTGKGGWRHRQAGKIFSFRWGSLLGQYLSSWSSIPPRFGSFSRSSLSSVDTSCSPGIVYSVGNVRQPLPTYWIGRLPGASFLPVSPWSMGRRLGCRRDFVWGCDGCLWWDRGGVRDDGDMEFSRETSQVSGWLAISNG